jgi:hypothetical protein
MEDRPVATDNRQITTENSPILVFADDWGRHPSSCQHLVRHLLDRHPTCWVNTIGTRQPKLDWATLRRALGKIRQWLRPTSAGQASAGPLPPNLRVLNPRMWPSFGSAFGRRLNRTLLAHQLAPLIRSLPALPVAVTTIPLVADLMGALPVRRWVYYCVDDFGEWPGLDGDTLRRMEQVVVRRADTIIAVSRTLQDKLAGMGRESHLLTHGVDLDFWSDSRREAPGAAEAIRARLAALERPLVLFWGVIDRRMDVALVRRLAGELERGTVVLAGPEEDPDPALFASPRIVRLGRVPFEQLPSLAREAAALIMPYADLPVTRAMQPLKLKEYLATGRSTVVSGLPATRPWADCLDVAETPEAFARAVRLRLSGGLPSEQQAARVRLAGENWAAKAAAFERWALREEFCRDVAS